MKDGKKNMHISKNWKKDEGLDTEMYYWNVCSIKQSNTHSFGGESDPYSKSLFFRPDRTLRSLSRSVHSLRAISLGSPESYCDVDPNLRCPYRYASNSATNRDSCSIGSSTDHIPSNSTRIRSWNELDILDEPAAFEELKSATPTYFLQSIRLGLAYHSPDCFAIMWRSLSNPPATITSSRTKRRLVKGRQGQEIAYLSLF